MTGKSVMLDLDDPRMGKVAEVVGSKTAKKILGVIAESQDGMSESEIASELGMKMNTVGYNIKKLKGAGLIEAKKGFLWSSKGKRVYKYKAVGKRIVISPRIGVRGVVPALIVSILGAAGIKFYYDRLAGGAATGADLATVSAPTAQMAEVAESAGSSAAGVASDEMYRTVGEKLMVESGSEVVSTFGNVPDVWAWFFIGGLTVLLVIILWNWSKNEG